MRFLYLFDFGDEWHFEITVLAIKENELAPATIIESIGENPQQYPDWEDEEEDEDDDD